MRFFKDRGRDSGRHDRSQKYLVKKNQVSLKKALKRNKRKTWFLLNGFVKKKDIGECGGGAQSLNHDFRIKNLMN